MVIETDTVKCDICGKEIKEGEVHFSIEAQLTSWKKIRKQKVSTVHDAIGWDYHKKCLPDEYKEFYEQLKR